MNDSVIITKEVIFQLEEHFKVQPRDVSVNRWSNSTTEAVKTLEDANLSSSQMDALKEVMIQAGMADLFPEAQDLQDQRSVLVGDGGRPFLAGYYHS